MKKKKLLIVYNKIWPYRLCIFNQLATIFDLTVAVNDKSYLRNEYNFEVLYLPTKKVGPFQWHRNSLKKIVCEFDCVVGLYDIRWIRLMLTSILSKTPFLFWGIGVTASYKNRFDSSSKWDKVRLYFAKRSQGVLLYSDYPVKKHLDLGLPQEKIWVSHNTTDVSTDMRDSMVEKKSILFVGTLYKEKGILQLLQSYKTAYDKKGSLPPFEVVGDGEDFNEAESFIKQHQMNDLITLHGAVYDRDKLAKIFNRAFICISPDQAGLSVLSSMGMGVPFATRSDAITGGEIFNIEHMVNGIFIDKIAKNNEAFFIWLGGHLKELKKMGNDAFEFYTNNRLPSMTVEIIKNAVNTAILKSKQ